MTPAQASGRYDFVTDVPVQGPTDEGIRAADCWWSQSILPVRRPACVDCRGPIPLWANAPTVWGGGWPEYGGNGGGSCPPGPIRYGSRNVAGFSLDGANDPAATVSTDQQAWVMSTLANLNTQIGQATGTSCRGWQDQNLVAMVGCFQGWYNANSGGSLRTDGVLDQDTLTALQATATAHAADFPTPYPAAPATAPAAPAPAAPATVPEPPPAPIQQHAPTGFLARLAKLSTPAKVGIGLAGTVVGIGTVYAIASRSASKGAKKKVSERRRYRRRP
jgi:hypothetical protein